MLDIRFIRDNPDKVKTGIAAKGVKDVDIDRLLELDKKRRGFLTEVEKWQHDQNMISEVIARAHGHANEEEIKQLMERAVEIKVEIQKLQPDLEFTQREYDDLMLRVPNLPLPEVPVGASEKDNVVIREVWYDGDGVKKREEPYKIADEKDKQFTPPWPHDFKPRDYMEIAEKLDWIDTERAAKVAGTRFGYLKRDAALLEFALVEFAFKTLTSEGFVPVVPPVMLKPEAMRGMGYLERGGDEIYYLAVDDLYLAGTSEQAIGPMHKDEVFGDKDLPRRYAGFSSCFRREAGSYGKDTRGILRVHQFDKVEMFSFVKPGDSAEEHARLLGYEEKLMVALRLPYRVVQMCTADLGDSAAAKYDIETWLPGQGAYRETHSTSNTTDFQARRLNIKYKPMTNNRLPVTNFVHMLNGTAFAIGRTIIAIIENYQQKDGTVEIPEVLKPFMP